MYGIFHSELGLLMVGRNYMSDIRLAPQYMSWEGTGFHEFLLQMCNTLLRDSQRSPPKPS